MFHKDIVTELIHHAQIHLVRMLIDCPDTDKSQKVTETNGFADFIEKEVFPLSSSWPAHGDIQMGAGRGHITIILRRGRRADWS